MVPNTIVGRARVINEPRHPQLFAIAAAMSGKDKEKFLKDLKKEFELKVKKFTEAMDQNYNIIAAHFYILDLIHHYYIKDTEPILEFYDYAAKQLQKILKKTKDKDLIIMVSDHGQKAGIHTKFGFYSSNKELGLVNPKITEFREIVESYVDTGELSIERQKAKISNKIKQDLKLLEQL